MPISVLGMGAFTSRAIRSFHAADVEVHAWTINEPTVMDRLLAVGVDGLVSDRADLALEAVARFRA